MILFLLFTGTEATVFSKGSLANDTCIKVNNRNSFVFGVMACEDAVVRLTDAMYVMDDEEDYIVHIGYDGNSRTTLIRGKSYLVGVNSPDILNCTAGWFFSIVLFLNILLQMCRFLSSSTKEQINIINVISISIANITFFIKKGTHRATTVFNGFQCKVYSGL